MLLYVTWLKAEAGSIHEAEQSKGQTNLLPVPSSGTPDRALVDPETELSLHPV